MKRSVTLQGGGEDGSEAVIVEYYNEDGDIVTITHYDQFDFAVAQAIEDFIFGGEVSE